MRYLCTLHWLYREDNGLAGLDEYIGIGMPLHQGEPYSLKQGLSTISVLLVQIIKMLPGQDGCMVD